MSKVIDRWFDMIRINSINGHEVDLPDYIAGQLKEMGLETSMVAIFQKMKKK